MAWKSSYTADYDAGFKPNPDPPGAVNPDFAVEEVSEDNGGYITSFGWTAHFRIADNLPDQMRLGNETVLSQPTVNQDQFYRKVDAEEKQRESIVSLDAKLRPEMIGGSGKAAEDNPYRKGWPDAPRPTTAGKNPNRWTFFRPFDTDANGSRVGKRRLNGDHFSMADHRRNYEIMGMAPVRQSRNTYRIEPTPWDEELVDGPTNSPGYKEPINYETGTTGSRSYRL